MENVIEIRNVKKKFKGFELDIPNVDIPKGFATALIGENGAGKTTLLNILAGVRLDSKGTVSYFDEKETDIEKVRESIGYTGTGNFFLPHWKVEQIDDICNLLFDSFDDKKFNELVDELVIPNKKISDLSDGNRVKLALCTALARDTKCLLLDEPASALDPLMRDKLCEIIREYLEEGNGEKSVIFSTHNITDMENVTDYCIIVEQGSVVESGFVEDLKNKYVAVKGEAEFTSKVRDYVLNMHSNKYGFDGICLAKDMERFAGMDVSFEIPTLHQISVAVMKQYSLLGLSESEAV